MTVGKKNSKLRNRVAQKLCNAVLKTVADQDYQEKIDLLIKQGMFHAKMGEGPYLTWSRDDE